MSENMPESSEGKKRYLEDELRVKPEAPLKYFQPLPDGSGRDRFGNRIFSSRDKSFVDQENEEVKASLLVSQQGERLLKKHPGILQLIDHGLSSLHETNGEVTSVNMGTLQLDDAIEMQYLASGTQSDVFLLEVNKNKFILKGQRQTGKHRFSSPVQPYTNEMLQVQAITADLSPQLDKLGVILPTFLFASQFMSCSEYVEGRRATKEEIKSMISSFEYLISAWMEEYERKVFGNKSLKELLREL